MQALLGPNDNRLARVDGCVFTVFVVCVFVVCVCCVRVLSTAMHNIACMPSLTLRLSLPLESPRPVGVFTKQAQTARNKQFYAVLSVHHRCR